MPYISPEARQLMDIPGAVPEDVGDLTYLIYRSCLSYIKSRGKIRFVTFAMVFGALVCAGLELYRRVVAPYEDWKIQENGDVR